MRAIRAEIQLGAFGNTVRNPRKFLGMEHNLWLLGVKNSVKRLRKLKMPVSLGSAAGGERGGVGTSANGQLRTVCNGGRLADAGLCAPAGDLVAKRAFTVQLDSGIRIHGIG